MRARSGHFITPENARDAVRALESLGFQPIAPVPAVMFADAEARRTAHARAVRVQSSSTVATVVALEDLVALKKAAGRPVDLADIEALRTVAEEDS